MARLNNIFDKVTYSAPKVTTFDGSHDIKTSFKMGEVSPLEVMPVYPKDVVQLKYAQQARFSPLVAPAFQRMSLKQWSFFVRNSDLWDNFDNFFTGVNPKTGRTAYTSPEADPVHPHFKLNSDTQCGSSYLGVRLNLPVVDLSKLEYLYNSDGVPYGLKVDSAYLLTLLDSIRRDMKSSFSVNYYDGSRINTIWNLTADLNDKTSLVFSRLFVSDGDNAIFYYADEDSASSRSALGQTQYPTNGNELEPSYSYRFANYKGFRALFSPSSLCDYLGYPSLDMKEYFNSPNFLNDLKKGLDFDDFDSVSPQAWITKYIANFEDKALTPTFVNFLSTLNENSGVGDYFRARLFVGKPVEFGHYSKSAGSVLDNIDYAGTTNLTFSSSDTGSSYPNTTVDFVSIVMRYLTWCKVYGHSTTILDSAPCFDMLQLKDIVNFSHKQVDSLRLRAYHKIWNDYFRQVNLTTEIPVPYADNGDDLLNYYNAVDNYLDANITLDSLTDWRKRNLYKDASFAPFPNLDSDTALGGLYVGNEDIRHYVTTRLMWDLLTIPFNHLRDRNYLTGALPNSSVVDVVAPVIPTGQLTAYENEPYTNNNIKKVGPSEVENDRGNIEPYKAYSNSSNDDVSPVGWLDLQNLKITEKLQYYFKALRHAMNGLKDFTKVFFDVDIDDLTLHRAKFLGGNQQYINVSELTGSAETEFAPLGQLGGKAQSYGESGVITEYVKECGFIITLDCFSPLEENIGGLQRQLIRESRFDYFNPVFAELGDMKISKIEVNCSPTFKALPTQYDDAYGYTQRYMDLKYIPSRVHADFLGAKSDWHLDLLEPPISSNNVELSQTWLEEKSDDRIFNDVQSDEDNCFVWCEVSCVYQRALPQVVYEVIA